MTLSHKYFKSLDELPAWNFFQVKQRENFAYLLKLDDYFGELPEVSDQVKPDGKGGFTSEANELSKVWASLYDEYIDKFSLSREYLEILNLRRKITILEAQLAISEDRFILNKIRHAKRQLDDLLSTDDDGVVHNSFEEQIIAFENWRKIGIDSMKITSTKFFTLRKQLSEESRKQQIKSFNNG